MKPWIRARIKRDLRHVGNFLRRACRDFIEAYGHVSKNREIIR
jgi:hypothetical protein